MQTNRLKYKPMDDKSVPRYSLEDKDIEILVISQEIPKRESGQAGANHLYFELSDLKKRGKNIHLLCLNQESEIKSISELSDFHCVNLIASPPLSFKKQALWFSLIFIRSFLDPYALYSNPKDDLIKLSLTKIISSHELDSIYFHWISSSRFLKYIRSMKLNVKYKIYLHDIDSQRVKRQRFRLQTTSKFLFKLTMIPNFLMVKMVERVERRIVRQFDEIFVPSIKDANLLKSICPNNYGDKIKVFPLFMKTFWGTKPAKEIKKIGFFGLLSRPENYSGIKWFADFVWPYIRKDFTLEIAGRGLPLKLQDEFLRKGISYMGEVDDIGKFISSNDLIVAPIFSGAGVKVKVVQSMSACRVVLGTEIALEGIDMERILPRCNTKNDFIDMIYKVKLDPLYKTKLENLSIKVARAYFDQKQE